MTKHEGDSERVEERPLEASLPAPERDMAAVEQRLEDLADELSRIIGACPPGQRAALHDYAVSLVRERSPAIYSGEEGGDSGGQVVGARDGGTARVGVGYGLLLIPVGLLVSAVLPPLGAVLLAVGGAMMGLGMLAAALSWLRSLGGQPRD